MQPWRWLRHCMKRSPSFARSHWTHVPMLAQEMFSRYLFSWFCLAGQWGYYVLRQATPLYDIGQNTLYLGSFSVHATSRLSLPIASGKATETQDADCV